MSLRGVRGTCGAWIVRQGCEILFPPGKLPTALADHYDVIIVGAGAAGAIVAAWLIDLWFMFRRSWWIVVLMRYPVVGLAEIVLNQHAERLSIAGASDRLISLPRSMAWPAVA